MSTPIAPTGMATPYPASSPETSASATLGSLPGTADSRDRFQRDARAASPGLDGGRGAQT